MPRLLSSRVGPGSGGGHYRRAPRRAAPGAGMAPAGAAARVPPRPRLRQAPGQEGGREGGREWRWEGGGAGPVQRRAGAGRS